MTDTEVEIDLRPAAAQWLKGWRRVLTLTAAALLLVVGASLAQPRTYSSTATLLFTRSRAVLELAQQFPTITDVVDSRARIDALLSLAASDAVASQTYNELQSQSPAITFAMLRANTEASARGDTILISARMDTPEQAALAANAWARQAAAAINQAYSGSQPLNEIEVQLTVAQEAYAAAQQKLEAYLAESRLPQLQAEHEQLAAGLLQQASESISLAALYQARRLQMQQLNLQARYLKEQIESGSRSNAGSTGDALAVLVLRTSLLGLGSVSASPTPAALAPASPVQLNLQLSPEGGFPTETSQTAADLEAVIRLSAAEDERLEKSLRALQAELASGVTGQTLEPLATHMRTLDSQLEVEHARQQQLTSERDLTWQTYQALSQKSAEIRAATLTNQYITVAAEAVAPSQPDGRGLLLRAALAGLAGLLLGTVWALWPLLARSLHELRAWRQA